MVNNYHYIELYINNELVELESQSSLGLRIDKTLFNPTRTSTNQVEYSYSFEIPSTPVNDRILGYANNLSRTNKFHTRYRAQVYADGYIIFDGSLTVQKYDARNRMYTCNLVNIKISSVEEIFGEKVMTDLKWEVPFDGAPTINEVNENYDTKYFFPLVSYGVFQKVPYNSDEISNDYTPKHDIDKYNKWWIESFYPSLNVIESMKKAFEGEGYNVIGNALFDPNISNIYASCNLADGQTPIYNIGNNRFGNLSIRTTWNNYASVNATEGRFGNITGGFQQDLNFPYYKMTPYIRAGNRDSVGTQWNFSTINVWNMLDSKHNTATTVTVQAESYMYDPDEMIVVVPADGWYRIYMSVNATLSGQGTSFNAEQWTNTYRNEDDMEERTVSIKRGFKELTPLEIQLVRNYDENIELIKGYTNVVYDTGDPNQETYQYRGGGWTGSVVQNRTEWITEYPHQDLYGSRTPTKTDSLIVSASSSRDSTSSSGASSGGATTRGGTIDRTGGGRQYSDTSGALGGRRGSNSNVIGYVHKDGYVMPYDPAVSTAFICGFSTIGNGTMSVMRNGYSWSKMSSVKNKVFADVKGLDLLTNNSYGGVDTTATNYCQNTYNGSTNYLYSTDNTLNGILQCCVYLNKNDILELVAVQRDYGGQKYACSADCTLQITAITDRSEAELRSDPYWNAYSEVEFPKYLNLFNFTNNETKVSEWINNVQKAFNLDIVQNGNTIEINTNKGLKKDINYAVDIDDRVSSDEAVSEYISYPREMSVKYKIDTDEWGYELTIPPEHIDDEGDEWRKWGDSGFTVISLSDDSYDTSVQNTQTNFSYTYYDNFTWKEVLENGDESGFKQPITIPVIEKAEYMAEGYGYDDAMKHDGYSMTQRFWYRDQVSQEYVYLADHMHEQVYLTYPMNTWNDFNLSYKDTEKSIVTEYFNVKPLLSSNYVTVDVHLNPAEYNDIKGGAMIHFDSDLYYISEIKGYDPQGGNTTELKMIKKA